MAARGFQTAIIQSAEQSFQEGDDGLPIAVSHTEPVPAITSASPCHVLVRVLAVALSPIDYKMVTHFPVLGNMVGCDFCGVIVEKGTAAGHDVGTRVCGASFPYSRPLEDSNSESESGPRRQSGAFASFVLTDSRLLLRVPSSWDDTERAALGQVGWATAALAISDPGALALGGLPSAPAVDVDDDDDGGEQPVPVPVMVYGAATATGTMACQLLAA